MDNDLEIWNEILDSVWGSGRIGDSEDLEEIETEFQFEIDERFSEDEFPEETKEALEAHLKRYLERY
jgi:hypothetical protein